MKMNVKTGWKKLDSCQVTSPDEMMLLCQTWFEQHWKTLNHSLVLINGQMGVGKTTFVRGFQTIFGISKTVNSPTFNLLNEYMGQKIDLFHYDLYRIVSVDELHDLDFIERWFPKQENSASVKPGIHVIEWYDRAGPDFFENSISQHNLYRINILEVWDNDREFDNLGVNNLRIDPIENNRRVELFRYG